MDKRELLTKTTFGSQVAEDEYDALASYFVETEEWRQIHSGQTDVIYGPKGSGKSALYLLLLSRGDLAERGVLVVAAENPRGDPAFSDIVQDPPTSEEEFRGFWKLYLLSLIGDLLDDWGIYSSDARQVIEALESAGLRVPRRNLRTVLKKVAEYARAHCRVNSLEGGVHVDAVAGVAGVQGKITFGEPSAADRRSGHVSVDDLLAAAQTALEEQDFEVWLALDRLDVAFAETRELEQRALRALFRVYIDLSQFQNIRLKIFLRDDIWDRITSAGFREASHITRQVTLSWNESSLLNLIVRRAVSNDVICEYYGVTAESILADLKAQRELFYRIFPDQVERGERKSTTLKWMVGRARDGTARTAPREFIHLFESARREQIKSLDIGGDEPSGVTLISGAAIKSGLPVVSRARLERSLYAEYPEYKPWVEKLDGQKTEQTEETLSNLWAVDSRTAASRAQRLAEVGPF